jgi:hypothetical protein
MFVQHTNLARIETIEASNRLDGLISRGGSCRGKRHMEKVSQ